jgi:hypothetical protein
LHVLSSFQRTGPLGALSRPPQGRSPSSGELTQNTEPKRPCQQLFFVADHPPSLQTRTPPSQSARPCAFRAQGRHIRTASSRRTHPRSGEWALKAPSSWAARRPAASERDSQRVLRRSVEFAPRSRRRHLDTAETQCYRPLPSVSTTIVHGASSSNAPRPSELVFVHPRDRRRRQTGSRDSLPSTAAHSGAPARRRKVIIRPGVRGVNGKSTRRRLPAARLSLA